jgi:pyruvate, water dikinase
MKRRVKVIAWFEDVNKNDIGLVGGKGANLGELTQAKIPVPPGFIVTSEAYFDFIKSTKLEEFISHYLKDLDVNDSNALTEIADQIKAKINNSTMPDFIVDEIKAAYAKLGDISVAVRSSATAEDLPEASFAGQQRTFLNVKGESDVVKAVQGCWASLFEPRAIFYRAEHNFDHLKVGIAVPVQKMVVSESSGVMFTIEPLQSDKTKILIEAIFGLGELIVSGDVTPDQYLLDKEKLKILEKHINKQEWQMVGTASSKRELEGNERLKIAADKQGLQKLSDTDIVALAKIGKSIEDLYGSSQDIEWAKEKDKLYIVQARPVTTIKETAKKESLPEIKEKPILTGVAASPGILCGRVRIVMSISEIDKVKPGDVLVAEMTTPDFVPAMKRAVAIVTDRGGRTAHAAIVSRELSIPCVVGTEKATKTLKDGQEITVDGYRGTVYAGRVTADKKAGPTIISGKKIKTRTKIYVNLAEPELAETIAARNVDGVGLLRAEFMVAHIGGHPRFMLHEGKREQFVDALTRGIGTFTKAFYPRPVVYRATDFKTNEYRNLKGGDRYEGVEENPMIGYRGCSRYTHELDVFRMEIEAIKSIRRDYDNLYVMIPFVRFVDEVIQIKSFLKQEGLYEFPNFKLWMMVEVPSNIFLIDKFIDAGVDGISIGSNDLTQLVLGIDRDNAKLAPLFDERNEAVMMAIERAVTTAAAKGITASICGQAPSVYPEITEKVVKWGITSVSVSPDMIDETRLIVAAAEEKLGKK